VPVGASFKNRTELRASSVHPPLQSGIHGTKSEGADSIVVSGGYPDDEDHGDVIIYTGAGGTILKPSGKSAIRPSNRPTTLD
jgi:putative restriction endonuclease